MHILVLCILWIKEDVQGYLNSLFTTTSLVLTITGKLFFFFTFGFYKLANYLQRNTI